ncbi:MAG: hypothetical protein V3V18_00570 [Methylococcales bacterium]
MNKIETPPFDSIITVENSFKGVTIKWKHEVVGSRFFSAAFLFFWLGGWAMAEVKVSTVIIRSFANSEFPNLFLVFWFGCWTIGGLAALSAFFGLFMEPTVISLYIDHLGIVYQPDKSKKIHAEMKQISNLSIKRIGRNLRLSFDLGAKRIEIGSELNEPEKEWLYKVLRNSLKLQQSYSPIQIQGESG